LALVGGNDVVLQVSMTDRPHSDCSLGGVVFAGPERNPRVRDLFFHQLEERLD